VWVINIKQCETYKRGGKGKRSRQRREREGGKKPRHVGMLNFTITMVRVGKNRFCNEERW